MKSAKNYNNPIEPNSSPHLFSEENFKLFDRITSAAYFLCNPSNGKIIKVSQTVTNLSGYSTRRFFDGGIAFFASMIHSADSVQMARNYARLVRQVKDRNFDKTPDLSESYKFRIKHMEGRWVWIEMDFLIVDYSEEGSIGKVFGLLKEVSNGHLRDQQQIAEHQVPINLSQNRNGTSQVNGHTPSYGASKSEGGSGVNGLEKISSREKEVLQLIARGFSSKMIADKLFISAHTAVNHRKNLINKFGVRNTAELICEAAKSFWL